MKQIILTIVLCSVLPAIAVAEDNKMQNSNISISDIDMAGKHMMMNSNPSISDTNMKNKKHMGMGDNPFSSHDKKTTKKHNQVNKGYRVIKYKK